MREAEQALTSAKKRLEQLLTLDEAVQAEVVEALRGKVSECGYNVSSTPFELLQNADDASVEYYEMFGGNEQTRPDGARFVVCAEAATLRFMHWGRPINKYRHNQFDGSDRGFRSDLSKMLALGESDKLSGVETKNTTGRFGLGFKSVFLLADRPRIVSGWLAFEVVAGIYPKRLEAPETERLRSVLHGRGPADGTLVELELKDPSSLEAEDGPLFRFLKLVHLLVICTRQVHRLELHIDGRPGTFEWNPSTVCGLANVKIGRVRPWNEATPPCFVLVLGQGRGSLLLRLDSRGLTAFDADVPTVWATAPTIHADDFGMVVNGDFELDPGRMHLLDKSPENRNRAAALGRAVGEQLVQLFDASVQDWAAFQSALHLDPECTPESFWQSTFALLADRFTQHSGPSQVLLKEVLWEGADRGLHRLVTERCVVPNGLPSPHAALVRVADIRFAISTSLLAEAGSVFSKIAGWPSFQRHVNPGACIAQDVLHTLNKLSVELPTTQLLGPMEIIRFEVEGKRVDAASARRVMTVLNPQLVEAAVMDLRQGRSSHLGEFLRDVELVGCDGNWHSVRELLAPTAEDDEERRAAFAPAAAVLSPEYRHEALEFVRHCRILNGGRMRIGVSELCRWALDAEDENTRLAVLNYLVDGGLVGLGDALREQIADDPEVWLADLHEGTLLRRAFPDDVNRQQLVLARMGLVKTLGWVTPPVMDEEEVIPPPPADPGVVLRRIAAAWRNEAGRRDYESKLYAGDRPPTCSLENLTTDGDARKEWMRLLMAGSLHTMGMSQIGEYGKFVSLCKQKEWLNEFSDPQIDPRRWMKVLDEFLEHAVRHIEYHRAMQRFICFYQFARHLRDYAHCFGDMNHMFQETTLSQVLRSRENSLQAGGGADAPPLTQALGIGACFVVRELVHGGFIPPGLWGAPNRKTTHKDERCSLNRVRTCRWTVAYFPYSPLPSKQAYRRLPEKTWHR